MTDSSPPEPTSGAPASQLAAGDTIDSRYRILNVLGGGGMGCVYSAEDQRLGVPVALKALHAELCASPEERARFKLEAEAAARLARETVHVVAITDHGVWRSLPYLVMELLEGEDLGRRLHRVGRLSLADAAGVGMQICSALRKAAALGLVHRDIKPGNVYLARRDDVETAKLLDFGIVKDTRRASDTKTSRPMGTCSYMPPEQILNTKVDTRTDLFALGVMLFEAVTGRLPFRGTVYEVVAKTCTTDAPPPSRFAPDLSAEVDAFFARALARSMGRRFQTAAEMGAALAALARLSWPPPSAPNPGRVPDPPPSSTDSGRLPDLAAPGSATVTSRRSGPLQGMSATYEI